MYDIKSTFFKADNMKFFDCWPFFKYLKALYSVITVVFFEHPASSIPYTAFHSFTFFLILLSDDWVTPR